MIVFLNAVIKEIVYIIKNNYKRSISLYLFFLFNIYTYTSSCTYVCILLRRYVYFIFYFFAFLRQATALRNFRLGTSPPHPEQKNSSSPIAYSKSEFQKKKNNSDIHILSFHYYEGNVWPHKSQWK